MHKQGQSFSETIGLEIYDAIEFSITRPHESTGGSHRDNMVKCGKVSLQLVITRVDGPSGKEGLVREAGAV